MNFQLFEQLLIRLINASPYLVVMNEAMNWNNNEKYEPFWFWWNFIKLILRSKYAYFYEKNDISSDTIVCRTESLVKFGKHQR